MAKFNPFLCSLFYSKVGLYRLTFIFGLCFVSYLLMYKVDINATAENARDLLMPIINRDRATVPIVVVPLIPISNATSTTSSSTPGPKDDKLIQTTAMNYNLTSQSKNNSQNTSAFEQPKEAFVTFSNNQPAYLAVLKVLLDSVHAFSTRPIIAFGIDVDLDIDLQQYPRVIKRRIKQSDCGPVRHHPQTPIKTIHPILSF